MAGTISAATFLKATVDVVGADVCGSLVLLHLKNWTYLELNDTGVFIWNLFTKPTALSSVISALTKEYKVEAEACQRETLTFLEDLVRRGFLTVE